MIDELLPCPFCGCKALLHYFSWYAIERNGRIQTSPYWQVKCDGCGALLGDYKTKGDAIASWNHREVPKARRVTVTMDERHCIGHTECSACHEAVGLDDRFCRMCGRELG